VRSTNIHKSKPFRNAAPEIIIDGLHKIAS